MQIKINAAFPNFKELSEAFECFTEEGSNLETALHNALPGGTYDQLLRAMLLRKASQFVVPFGVGN
ncbi:MAG: hypothetical protein WC998_01620 [Candidatus Paceibacterota bacterium]|jgi:hypothetical protein